MTLDHASSLPSALVGALAAAAEHAADAPALSAALAAHDLSPLLRAARFGDDTYVRVPLWASARAELRLLCWRPGQSSALHGHGASACAFRVVSGVATELRLDGERRILRAGDVAVAEPGRHHQVANLGAEPLVTAHLYSPPIPVDQPSSGTGRRVVIVGAGFSGLAVAVHLLRSGDAALRVTLVEPRPVLGVGPAFDAAPELLLNVPAGRMSLDPADPDDFVRFASAHLPTVDRSTLAPRQLYGRYLLQRLGEALTGPVRLRLAPTRALAAERVGGGYAVATEDGRVLPADELVIASGLGPPALPPAWTGLRLHPRLAAAPLAPGALDAVPPDARVLVLGTGLTAVDVVTALLRRGHVGPIVASSRRGWWPRPHLPDVTWAGAPAPLDPAGAPNTADGLAWWLATHVATTVERGLPWQVGLDAVRPHVPGLWARLDKAERQRFLTWWRPVWEVVRHRAPTGLVAALDAAHARGALRTHAGVARPVSARPDGFEVALGSEVVRFDHVLACTGWVSDPRRFGDPLWDDLLASGSVTVDDHGLGVVTDEVGAAVDERGKRTGPWVMGALQRPRWFESTAVPELAVQAQRLAAALRR